MERIIASCFCFLIISWSVLELCKRVLQIFTLVLAIMDYAYCLTFVVMGFGSQAFSLVGMTLFLLLGFGFKFLQVSCLLKGPNLVQSLCNFRGEEHISSGNLGGNHVVNSPKCGLAEVFDQKIVSRKSLADGVCYLVAKSEVQSLDVNVEDNVDRVQDCDEELEARIDRNEDEEFDIVLLRRLVKTHRKRAESAREELESERLAAASAAQEAMAKILVLQTEKSHVEMEGNQYRRMAEERQMYSEGVVEGLQWMVVRQEDEISRLEEELRSCRQELKKLTKRNHQGDD